MTPPVHTNGNRRLAGHRSGAERATTAVPVQAGVALDTLADTRSQLRSRARSMLGVNGASASDAPPLATTLRTSGATWYSLIALCLLVVVDQFQANALIILGPEVTKTLGISTGTLAGLTALKGLAAGVATLPIAALVQRRPRRATIAVATAVVWSLVTALTGLVPGLLFLALVLIVDGASTGSVQSVHVPLLMDSYPAEARVRALAAYRGADSAGNVLAPFGIFLLTAGLAFTWRGVFLVLGAVSLAAALYASRLKDPGFGVWDTARIRNLVREREGGEVTEADPATDLGFFEIMRRVAAIPTERAILGAFAVFGMMLYPLQTFFAFFLDEKWNFDAGQRALFTAMTSASAVGVLAIFGRRAESLFRRDPGALVERTAMALASAMVFIAMGALMTNVVLMALCFVAAFAVVPALFPAFSIASMSIVPPTMRTHAQALVMIFTTGVGGLLGSLLLGSIDRRFGISGAIVVVCVPGLLGALLLRRAARTIVGDLDRLIDDIVDDEEIKQLTRSGGRVPLLACRDIDFAYGQLQVLFGVDFTVEAGEMVALLGTNGAGKSTLLRVISGLAIPQRGSVRLQGADITFLDAERRTSLGINQIPGGKAVFGPLSVVENLRLFGFTLDQRDKTVDEAIETAFNAFPRLAERRNQAAQTLSGGEQQMLALTKALMLQPRVLLIDELSLGLAPVIVGQLLDMVRRINAEGTAVVLVEQSVNVALSLVREAYFMEKGEIRFSGAATDLLLRGDLLRSVFLEGSGSAGGHAPTPRRNGSSR